MNKPECDILTLLSKESFVNQRILSEASGHSLGIVNRSLKNLVLSGYLNDAMQLTETAKTLVKKNRPKNAVILAAGFGMRMVPINLETPKGLLEINGEKLIERLIKQLQEVGVKQIYIVVGFMKERFEYLIDKYNVELIVNAEYAAKNNLHSLKLAKNHLSNAYIIPSDIWCKTNPFKSCELYSWYMMGDTMDSESDVKVTRKAEVVKAPANLCQKMIGISYIADADAKSLKQKVEQLSNNPINDNEFWERALYYTRSKKTYMSIPARVESCENIIEINTYEQLRELDKNSNQLKSEAITVIKKVFNASEEEITNLEVLKKGMTNRSFMFSCRGAKYIMRIPGEGTNNLINRKEEADVYKALSGKEICDDPVYINSENGFKITKFLSSIRCCDPLNVSDLEKCMARLRSFHEMKLTVDHEFNIFEKIEFYESLWDKKPSMYSDYITTKSNVYKLKPYIEKYAKEKCLTHIDAVPDNFLFYDVGEGEKLQLTDWEYAGMQDPHVDIAMFCIYSLYNKEQIDRLISIYFKGNCPVETKIKIYCYIAACGMLWSNWCEYKSILGVEFGEYSLRQYRYAKDYYKIAIDEINSLGLKI